MRATSRFAVYAAIQTAVVAVLAGIAAPLTLFTPFGMGHYHLAPAASDLAAQLTVTVLQVLVVVMAALFVLVPISIAGYLSEHGEYPSQHYIVGAGVSMGGLAVLLGMIPYGGVGRLDRRGLMVLAAAVLGLAVAYSIVIAWPAANRGGRPALALLLNHVFVGTFVIGFLFAPVAAPPTQGLVEEHSLSPPQTAFDHAYTPTDDDQGVLTITHDGGDHIPVDRVWIHGEGFAAVEGADQTQAGRWQGETTARSDGQAGVVVEEGDSVGVGVTDGCVIRVVYMVEGSEATLGKYTCGG